VGILDKLSELARMALLHERRQYFFKVIYFSRSLFFYSDHLLLFAVILYSYRLLILANIQLNLFNFAQCPLYLFIFDKNTE
jgi:hypothetical protein